MTPASGVDNAQINLGYTTIYAPVTGLIGFLNYDVGNVVGGQGTQVLDTIIVDRSDQGQLRAGRADVPAPCPQPDESQRSARCAIKI